MTGSDAITKGLELLLLFVSGGGAGTWLTTLRKDRREARRDDRDAAKDRIDIVASLWSQLDKINERALKAEDRAEEANVSATRAQEKATKAQHESVWLRGIVTSFIRPVVAWIDGGAQPPPPEISAEVRTVLAAVTDHNADGGQQ